MSQEQPTSTDIEGMLRRLGSSFKSIKLPGGVIGKTTRAMLALAGVWALIIWQIFHVMGKKDT
jgi:hypothetical protein